MSNATYEGGAAGNRAVKLTGTGATDIVLGTEVRVVKALYVTEIAGGTPSVSVEVYDGTTSVYLLRSKPHTARATLEWGDIPLNKNQKVRVTSSVADQIDVFAVVVERNPGAGS
jgi:hypothetical protein